MCPLGWKPQNAECIGARKQAAAEQRKFLRKYLVHLIYPKQRQQNKLKKLKKTPLKLRQKQKKQQRAASALALGGDDPKFEDYARSQQEGPSKQPTKDKAAAIKKLQKHDLVCRIHGVGVWIIEYFIV